TNRWSHPSRSLRKAIHLPSGDGWAPALASPVMLQNFSLTSSWSTFGSPPPTSTSDVIRRLKSDDVRSTRKCLGSSHRRPPNPPSVPSETGAPPDADTALVSPGTFSVIV